MRAGSKGVPSYSVEFVRSATRELEGLDDTVLERVFRRVERLTQDPRPPGCKKLRGAHDLWRIRIGDYRVVYRIDDAQRLVEIRAIGHRRDVYG